MAKIGEFKSVEVAAGRQALTVKSASILTAKTGTTSVSFRAVDANGAAVFLKFAHTEGGRTLLSRFAKVVGLPDDFDDETLENCAMTSPNIIATVESTQYGPNVRPDWVRA